MKASLPNVDHSLAARRARSVAALEALAELWEHDDDSDDTETDTDRLVMFSSMVSPDAMAIDD